MILPIPVFSEQEAIEWRGSQAEGMIVCPACDETAGVFIAPMNKQNCRGISTTGAEFNVIVWERWNCVKCRTIWVEKYGVAERDQEDEPRDQGYKPSLELQ